MAKLSRLFLSMGMLIIGLSCKQEHADLNTDERRTLAEEVFRAGAHLPQGSPKSMTRIAKAIAIDSTYAEALREHSVAYLKRGMPHKWKIWMDKAVYHDAKTWQPWRGYLYLWFYRDYKKAIADFNASDTLTPNFIDQPQGHSVDFWRGIAYLGLKDYENSIAFWNKHIAKETEEAGEDWVELEAFLYRGIALYESGKKEKALEDFEKIIRYFKSSADAKFYISKIRWQQGEKGEALSMLEGALRDYESGYYNQRPYVEALRQIYPEDLSHLKSRIMQQP
nr:tetratricopeptide repeat protein [uncultured Allomuricauda sp.]